MAIYTNEHLTDLLNEQYEKVRKLEKENTRLDKEIKTIKEQLANGLKILKAQKTILETRFNYHYCASDIFLEKQDKENKDKK